MTRSWMKGDRVFATAYRHQPVEEVRATSTVSQRIAEGHARNNAEKEKTLHEILPSVFWDFEDVFAKKSFNTLPDHREWDHAIELTGDGKSPAPENSIRCPRSSRQSWISSLRRTSHPAGSACPNPLWPHPSSLSKRRMDRSDRFRITDS